jgi:hypothetical protein
VTIPRAHLTDPEVIRWYHCVSRCARGAFLLGDGEIDRKEWLENRLEERAQIFAIGGGRFAVLDNDMHVLVRLDPPAALTSSPLPALTLGNGPCPRPSG